jgi:hypothetical protein
VRRKNGAGKRHRREPPLWEALSSRFAQLYRNLIGSPHKPFNPQTFTAAATQFLMLAGRCSFLLAGAPVRVPLYRKMGNGDAKNREKQLAAPAADDRRRVYHRFTAAGADAVCRPDAGDG